MDAKSRVVSGSLIFASVFMMVNMNAAQATEKPVRSTVNEAKASADQLSSLKPNPNERLKQAPSFQTTYYAYDLGVRRNILMHGTGAVADFRWEGTGTKLRYPGQVSFKTSSTMSVAEVSSLTAAYGVTGIRARDDSGKLWLGATPVGLEGIQMVNKLQESGKVLDTTMNWQRDLVKK